MMIEEFSEPNGNKLMFTYDNRGNLTKVMHSAYATKQASEQQFIQLDYGCLLYTSPQALTDALDSFVWRSRLRLALRGPVFP